MVRWQPSCGSILRICGLMGSSKGLSSGKRYSACWTAFVGLLTSQRSGDPKSLVLEASRLMVLVTSWKPVGRRQRQTQTSVAVWFKRATFGPASRAWSNSLALLSQNPSSRSSNFRLERLLGSASSAGDAPPHLLGSGLPPADHQGARPRCRLEKDVEPR